VGETESTSQPTAGLTVGLDTPSARILADQAAVIQDLQFVMDCCERLLKQFIGPDKDRDEVVSLALWSSALVAYARCFRGDGNSGLTVEDVRSLPLQGAVVQFHEWIIGESAKVTEHPPDPFEAARIGATLAPARPGEQRIEGIAVFTTSRILIDATGVRQLGGLTSELAKQTAVKAQQQQGSVLSDARRLDIASLYESPPLTA
jgi:hypothetical protein